MAENPAAAAALEETSDSSERCSAPGPKAVVAPWLVKEYSDPEGKKKHAFYNICGPKNETCRGFMPELIGTTCYQKPSHQGWLILVYEHDPDYYATHGLKYETPPGCSYGDCFLWNPTTDETIQLPTLLEYFKRRYGLMDCVLSSPPRMTANTNPDGGNHSDSMVLVLFQNVFGEHEFTFVFCRPGETQWRIHKVSQDIIDLYLSQSWVGPVVFFKGKFYVMCEGRNPQDDPLEHHLEIEEAFTKDNDLTISIKSFQVKKEVCLFPLLGGKANPSEYYVESHDELFRVDIIQCKDTYEVISIEVVKLNFELMEWEKVNSFGDHVLFLNCNDNSTACCSAAELGFTSGCLYYVQYSDRCLHKFQIESTGNTSILPDLWPTGSFPCLDWLIMPINVQQGRVKNMLGSEDEENGILLKLENETSTTKIVSDENQGGTCSAGEAEVASYGDNLNEVQATSFLSPWMVYSRDHNLTIFSVINPVDNNVNYVMNLSELAGSTIRFQKGGWLLMTRKHNIFFYNPFTRETVKLPDMDMHGFSVVSFSSSPTSSDCIVFVMDERDDKVYIDFIRRGGAHWVSLIFDSDRYIPFLDIAVFHDGAFFCVENKGTFGVSSVKDNSWKVFEKPHDELFYCIDCSPSFLVDCGGDLLAVKLARDEKLDGIFKLNFSEMEWVEVKSLGEHTLFVSDTSCVYALAPNSYMKNKIYFPRLYTKDGGIVFYSLETGSNHTLGSQHSAKNLDNTEGWFRNCTWIEPNRSISSVEELNWLKTPFP